MPNYENGKIYAIKSYTNKNVYIGSTIKLIEERLNTHVKDLRRYRKGKYHYVSSFEIVQFDNCYIELLEAYPCNTKKELEQREGIWIKKTSNLVNRFIAGSRNEIIECECSGQYLRHHKQRHFRSTKHKLYLDNKDNKVFSDFAEIKKQKVELDSMMDSIITAHI